MADFVYILYSAKLGKLYFGSTKDVALRLNCHNSGGSSYTSKGLPWELLYYSEHNSISEARKEERVWKNLKSRVRVLERISSKIKKVPLTFINETLYIKLQREIQEKN